MFLALERINDVGGLCCNPRSHCYVRRVVAQPGLTTEPSSWRRRGSKEALQPPLVTHSLTEFRLLFDALHWGLDRLETEACHIVGAVVCLIQGVQDWIREKLKEQRRPRPRLRRLPPALITVKERQQQPMEAWLCVILSLGRSTSRFSCCRWALRHVLYSTVCFL